MLQPNLVSFFKELDTGKELCSVTLVSFFNELDTRQGTVLGTPCFIF